MVQWMQRMQDMRIERGCEEARWPGQLGGGSEVRSGMGTHMGRRKGVGQARMPNTVVHEGVSSSARVLLWCERDGDGVRTDEGKESCDGGNGARSALCSCHTLAGLGTHSVDARVG